MIVEDRQKRRWSFCLQLTTTTTSTNNDDNAIQVEHYLQLCFIV